MDKVEHLGVREAAAFEGVSEKTLTARYRRHQIILVNDCEDGRRKFVPVSALSPCAYRAFVKAQTLAALHGVNGHPQESLCEKRRPHQSITPLLPFASPTQTETALMDAVPPAIPDRYRPFIDRWAAIVGDNVNGTWKRYIGTEYGGFQIRTRCDFIRAQAKIYDIGPSTIHARLKVVRDINHDREIPPERKKVEFWSRILPKNRPGRSGHSFFADPENAGMREKLLSFYLTQAKRSLKHAHRLLLADNDAKQRVWGAGHLYQTPTLHQCRTVLRDLDSPTVILAREGEKAYNDKVAPFISRRPPEFVNEIWTTDQKCFDIIMRDNGWSVGRFWTVNFVDVISQRWLGGACGPQLTSDLVMEAAAMALERAGAPDAVQMDLGKAFIGKRFTGGDFRISGEALYSDAVGLWKRLNVKVLKAIGDNPASKPIERWHGNFRPFEQSYPTYCGRNTKERPPILSEYEKQRVLFLRHEASAPPFPRTDDVVTDFFKWCENEWNAKHRGRGRYLQRMTPDEAWNSRQPPGGIRKFTRAEVNYYTADHRTEKVSRGGQINLTFNGQTVEYEAPELFQFAGANPPVDVKVIIGRQSLQEIVVIYPVIGGTASCVAKRKRLVGWNTEEDHRELLLRLRCKGALKRALKQSIKRAKHAGDLLAAEEELSASELATRAVDLQVIRPREFFGAKVLEQSAAQHPEIGSLEYQESHRPRKLQVPAFAEEAAREIFCEFKDEL